MGETEDTSFTVLFEAEGGPEGIPGTAIGDIRIYAAEGCIHVNLGGQTVERYSVYDLMGRCVARGGRTEVSTVRTEPLPAGVYLVRVGSMSAQRVVVR